ncbi:MAG: hypothetical protein DWQ15_04490 [Proteobacteria bacterium]|nr:MAG: hypothetical protein DWQ15_04490 [Pseudomonadota bacterium]
MWGRVQGQAPEYFQKICAKLVFCFCSCKDQNEMVLCFLAKFKMSQNFSVNREKFRNVRLTIIVSRHNTLLTHGCSSVG